MDSVQKETHVVSVMTDYHKETCAVVRDEKGRSSSPAPNSKAKTDEGGEKSSNTGREESSTDKEVVKTRHVDVGILPCVKTTSLRLDAFMEEIVSSDRLRRSPARSGPVALLKDST